MTNPPRFWHPGIAALLLVGMLSSACAALGPKIEGTIGAIRWHVTDLDQSDPRGQYPFTLVLTETQGVGMQIARIDWAVHQPGVGPAWGTLSCEKTMVQSSPAVNPAYVSRAKCAPDWRAWRLPANGELHLPFTSGIFCPHPPYCVGGPPSVIPLWRVTLTGTDDRNQPVRAVIDIALPGR